MKANFKTISTILIVFLTMILVAILVSYYNAPLEINDDESQNLAVTNQQIKKVIGENISGEIVSSDASIVSGDKSGDNTYQIIKPSNSIDVNDKNEPVIITSEDTMTNKEKREILTELDNTLMELLDVVDKVQTVDETRLVTTESEVQE